MTCTLDDHGKVRWSLEVKKEEYLYLYSTVQILEVSYTVGVVELSLVDQLMDLTLKFLESICPKPIGKRRYTSRM